MHGAEMDENTPINSVNYLRELHKQQLEQNGQSKNGKK